MKYLKELRLKKGVSQQTVAEYLEITRQAYSNYENGNRSPDNEVLLKLAEYFDTTVDVILRGPEKAPTQEGERSNAIRIPVVSSVPAGIPIEAIEDILDWEEIPVKMCSGGREYFGLQVKGDSMWPDYLPGDVVIVRRTPICDTGDICVVYVNGYDATLKEVKLAEDGSLTILPHNQNYAPRTYSSEEVQALPIQIAGVVVELRRKIK